MAQPPLEKIGPSRTPMQKRQKLASI